MNRGEDLPLPDGRWKLQYLSALLRHPEAGSQQGPNGRGSEADNQGGIDNPEFRLKPWPAGLDVSDLWSGMDPALASLGEAEVLDGIGDIDIGSGHPNVGKRPLQQLAGWPDERNALPILHVAWLLTDQSHFCSRVASREDNLGCRLPEFAAPAPNRRLPKLIDVRAIWHPRGGAQFDWSNLIRQLNQPRTQGRRRAACLPS
jgi:hypothetical protein